MNSMNLNSTQYVDYLNRRMQASGVPVPEVLRDIAERCDLACNSAYTIMKQQKNEFERRLADLESPEDEGCMHLGYVLDGSGQHGLRLEKLGAQIEFGKKCLQDGIAAEIARFRQAEKDEAGE